MGRYGLQMGGLDRFMRQAALILAYLEEHGETRWRELHDRSLRSSRSRRRDPMLSLKRCRVTLRRLLSSSISSHRNRALLSFSVKM